MTDKSRADELVDAAKRFAKYHEEHAGYGGASWEFHALATTHILTCAEYASDLESQLAAKDRRIEELGEELHLRIADVEYNAHLVDEAGARADKAEAELRDRDKILGKHETRIMELLRSRSEERKRADKAEAELRDTSSFCSRLQARVHLLEQLNADLQASEVGQLQEQLTSALQDKDVAEADLYDWRERCLKAQKEICESEATAEQQLESLNGTDRDWRWWRRRVREIAAERNFGDLYPIGCWQDGDEPDEQEADREWGRGEGSRLFPEEADRG